MIHGVSKSSSVLIALLAAAALAAGCGEQAASEEPENDNDEPARVPVETVTVETDRMRAVYSGTATLEAKQEATAVAETSGILRELRVEEGDTVERGEVIARLDDRRQRLEVDRAKASLERLDNEYERLEKMHAKDLASTEAFERARTEYRAQRAAYELAKLELDYTSIEAPIDGVIAQRLVKVGNLIQEHQALFEIDDFDSLEANLHVPERHFETLDKGQAATIRVDALSNRRYRGTVERISPVVDPETGTFKVTLEIPRGESNLKPGMFVRARIVHDTRDDVPVIPRAALIEQDGEQAVFTVREGKAKRVAVATGYADDQRIEIAEGVEPGAVVVTAGREMLKDGTPVEVIAEQ